MQPSAFEEYLTGLTTGFTPVVDAGFSVADYHKIDLSVRNPELTPEVLSTEHSFTQFLLRQTQGKTAWGGYDEERDLYRRSTLFTGAESDARNIHMGIDLWAEAGTPVLAVLAGVIHSFKDNAGYGDYGPTIILEHGSGEEKFYTLYGHLSRESLKGLTVGKPVAQGEAIAQLGSARENGDYAPHLHFQVIRNLGEYQGDFPGVASKSSRKEFLENCPDPNLLLKME